MKGTIIIKNKTTIYRLTTLTCVIALMLGLTACEKNIEVKFITPSETDIELVPGETASVGYTIDVVVGKERIVFDFPAVDANVQNDEAADSNEPNSSEASESISTLSATVEYSEPSDSSRAGDETLAAVEALVFNWVSSSENIASVDAGKIGLLYLWFRATCSQIASGEREPGRLMTPLFNLYSKITRQGVTIMRNEDGENVYKYDE